MDYAAILAQVVESGTKTPQTAVEGAIIQIDWIWDHVISLGTLEALTFMSFGAVCLFYGWRVFKILVVISFSIFGLVLGLKVSEYIGGESGNPLLGVLAAIILGVVSIPLMRWAVGILGALAGAVVTAGAWYALALPEQYIWAGGLIGFVAGGMISFIIFKIAIILFSSLGGSGLLVMGILAILHHCSQTTEQINELVFGEKWFLPVILMLPAALGVYLQNKFVKGSHDWNI